MRASKSVESPPIPEVLLPNVYGVAVGDGRAVASAEGEVLWSARGEETAVCSEMRQLLD